jgi:hypothetical protein
MDVSVPYWTLITAPSAGLNQVSTNCVHQKGTADAQNMHWRSEDSAKPSASKQMNPSHLSAIHQLAFSLHVGRREISARRCNSALQRQQIRRCKLPGGASSQCPKVDRMTLPSHIHQVNLPKPPQHER